MVTSSNGEIEIPAWETVVLEWAVPADGRKETFFWNIMGRMIDCRNAVYSTARKFGSKFRVTHRIIDGML